MTLKKKNRKLMLKLTLLLPNQGDSSFWIPNQILPIKIGNHLIEEQVTILNVNQEEHDALVLLIRSYINDQIHRKSR